MKIRQLNIKWRLWFPKSFSRTKFLLIWSPYIDSVFMSCILKPELKLKGEVGLGLKALRSYAVDDLESMALLSLKYSWIA